MKSQLHKIWSLLFTEKPQVICLNPECSPRGCVVISYITWPFVEGVDSPKMRGHTNAYEVTVMARVFLDLGYRVEVCDWKDNKYSPPADSVVAIDIHHNLERWSKTLPISCKKIFHATGPHWVDCNLAELNRLKAIQQRKGVVLSPRRQVACSRISEVADHISVLGNNYTIETYKFLQKPITRIPISSAYEFAWPQTRDFSLAKNNFLWVSSYGMVWKGLDLVLEAFADMPDLSLTVCGRPEKEEDFFSLYRKELTEFPNIKFLGWMDMSTPEFLEISRTHASIVHVASSEGGGGSAIHCMHAGLLPICTKETSVDLGDFGVLVENPTVECLQRKCREVATMSEVQVETRARKAYEHVRRFHTRAEFAKNFGAFAEKIVKS